MQKRHARPLQQNGQKTPGQATTAKQAKKRQASPPEYDIESGLIQSDAICTFLRFWLTMQ